MQLVKFRTLATITCQTCQEVLKHLMQDPEAAPEREWIESNRQVGIGRPDAKRLAEQVHQCSVSEKKYSAGELLVANPGVQ